MTLRTNLNPHAMNQPTPEHPFKSKSFWHSLGFACNGLKFAFHSERNLRTHTALTLMVLSAGCYYHISRWEWALLIMCIVIMVAVELLNTALEYLVDMLVDGQYNDYARLVKDIAAGACLTTAMGTAVIGALIFWPYLHGGF